MDKLIIDKLYERVEERGVVCLGLDTAVEYLPSHVLEGRTLSEALFHFNIISNDIWQVLFFAQFFNVVQKALQTSFSQNIKEIKIKNTTKIDFLQ